MGRQLGVTTLEQWYRVSSTDVIKAGGRALLTAKSDSLIKLLSDAYPNHNWVPWRFTRVPSGFWNIKENRIKALGHIATQLGIDLNRSSWQGLTRNTISNIEPGRKLLKYYNYSIDMMLNDLCYSNDRTSVSTRPTKSETTLDDRTQLDAIGEKLGIKTLDNWYKFSSKHVRQRAYGSSRLY